MAFFSLPSESICPYICPHWQEGPHLVPQQHDDHLLLGVLMDLSQPCLEMDRKHRNGDGIQNKDKKGKCQRYGNVAVMYKNTLLFIEKRVKIVKNKRLFNANPSPITIPKPMEDWL